MTIRAAVDKKFIGRYLIIAAICFGATLWCLYDGLIAYPKQLERSVEYANIIETDAKLKAKKWQEIAQGKGWPLEEPEEVGVVRGRIFGQFVMGGIAALIGLAFLINWIRSASTWVEATETGVRASWGPEFSFDQVLSINKAKWKSKGIAKVRYKDGEVERTFTIDDFKYERKPTGEVLKAVEGYLISTGVIPDPTAAGAAAVAAPAVVPAPDPAAAPDDAAAAADPAGPEAGAEATAESTEAASDAAAPDDAAPRPD